MDLLRDAIQMILDIASATGANVSGPVPLPTRRKLYCMLRSPHVNKDSREHFEVTIHRRLVDIKDLSAQTRDRLMELDIPAGVDTNVKLLWWPADREYDSRAVASGCNYVSCLVGYEGATGFATDFVPGCMQYLPIDQWAEYFVANLCALQVRRLPLWTPGLCLHHFHLFLFFLGCVC
ncbi:unnamed protein product [Ostreobium quekettii]|uniref:Small ribosomal subunit protein uS10 domain-containing protein n=1 Tax=Ostreobium quekettii TaxID=121088 RepID=A0A8S1IT20_9CHLO|nr:unnamed protein product [Ostreobium quekettii]